MFGSPNPFGQSTSSLFGTPPIFGQANTTNNPFAPKPFGSSSPFGSQTGQSIFGGTSTGVFGAAQSSSSLASAPVFGASSSPTFGSSAFGATSAPAFGASSAPAFGASSSSFGGSSIFGQKPAFGGFGSTTGQTSPFGSTFQQSQPAFGSSLFGSASSFGTSTVPAFGATSSPAFGAASTPVFGATSTPAFGLGSSSSFGSSTPAFGGSSPAFGSTTAFGVSSSPAFGASSAAFGASSTPTFGGSSTPSFSFGSSPAFGQSAPAFGGSTFGSTAAPFGASSSPFGSQTSASAFGTASFGQLAFGGQRGGSRAAPYNPTAEVDGGSGTQACGKLESISAMPVYREKSHEELRWEDYQLGDKGGPNQASQSAGGINFGAPAQSSPFGTSTFGHTTANPFSSATPSNPFAPKTAAFGSTGFGASTSLAFNSPFGASSGSAFGATGSSTTPSLFGPATAPTFGASSSPTLFGSSSTPAFGASSSPAPFGLASTSGTTPAFGSGLTFGSTQSSGLFQSTAPLFGQATSTFGSSAPAFGQTTTPTFGQPNPFGTPSTGFGGSLFTGSSTPSLLSYSSPMGFGQATPSLSTPFSAPAQTTSGFSFGGFGLTQPAASSGFIGISTPFGQGSSGQAAANQISLGPQLVSVANPFGTLPAIPQISFGRAGSSPVIQYGISSLPAAERPLAPTRVSALLATRHVSQRRVRLPPRKYHPKIDGPKTPFFIDEDEMPSTPKADALFIPRENPRALVICPMEQWPSSRAAEKQPILATPITDNGKRIGERAVSNHANGSVHPNHYDIGQNGFSRPQNGSPSRSNGPNYEDYSQKEDSYITLSGQRAGEAAIVYEHGADIEALMPKLRHADYYTEPRIQELAAKERAEPGYCRHVKDFVVGRHGYGCIRFSGETDVRRLDLESIVQFNYKEVIVYMDDSKKPPAGQGLNKPAEVTLLNIKCINKKTGEQYVEGPKVEKYTDMLVKKAQDQGAEFVSYDPVKGEWKFRVSHFSLYGFGDHVGEE